MAKWKAPPGSVPGSRRQGLGRLAFPHGPIEVPVDAWDAGLSHSEHEALELECFKLAGRVAEVIKVHPEAQRWSERAYEVLIAARMLYPSMYSSTGLRDLASFDPASMPLDEESAGKAFRSLLDVCFDRHYRVRAPDGRMGLARPREETSRHLQHVVPAVKELSDDILKSIGYPVDPWHSATAAAIILAGSAHRWALTLPFSLHRSGFPGETEVQRQTHVATGLSVDGERSALKARRTLQSEHGFKPVNDRPGPKPGSKQRPSKNRIKLQTLVSELHNTGISPQMIAERADVQSAYRTAKGDSAAVLSVQVVRALLRRRS